MRSLHLKPGTGSSLSTLKPRANNHDIRVLIGDFQNAILDFQLRVEIGRETAPIRELIIAKAFAEGDLLDDPPVGDWRDPVGARK